MTPDEIEKLVQRVVELEDKQTKLEHEMTRLRSNKYLSARAQPSPSGT
jgi:cell division protein FtsB